MKALIFDLDGTLWDSRENVSVVWNEVISQNTNLEIKITPKLLGEQFGKPMDIIFDAVFSQLEQEERKRIAALCCKRENEYLLTHPGVLYEGVKETIKMLAKEYPLYIVSNCQAGYIPVFLESTGLGEYFKDYTCPDDTGKLKADNIRIIMDRNGLKDVLYIGDTQGDANACAEAAIPMVFAAYGMGEVQRSDYRIERFEELLDIVKR